MRKWQFLAAAAVLAALAGLRLHMSRVPARQGPDAQPGYQGSPLPAGSTQYYEQAERLASSPQGSRATTYWALPTIKDPAYDRGPCEGGSLNAILSSHGRVWGELGRYLAFSKDETGRTYEGLASYFACVGLARRSAAPCDYLPAEGSDGVNRVEYRGSSNYQCRDKYVRTAFLGFAAGRADDDSACRAFLGGDEMAGSVQLPVSDFCSAASRGLGGVCGAMSRFTPKGMESSCRRTFPSGLADCGFSSECRDRLRTYDALRSGKAQDCPAAARPFCEAYLSKNEAACSALLLKTETDYCASLAKARKRTGGYPGLSPDETRDAIRSAAEKRDYDARMTEQGKKILDETNKRVRQILAEKDARAKK